uniref:Uncharacterized protein n=1 Tax=viral metagenome TaxID=1070528 RepID=A0A6C0ESV2_9ZZZZ
MSKRTISINPQFFNISKKKSKSQKVTPSHVNINSSNIRQLLLDKLREQKKTKKIETKLLPVIQSNTFDENCKIEENEVKIEEKVEKIKEQNKNEDKPEHIESDIPQGKPYGNLKNGTKPTFKSWNKEDINVPTNIIIEEKEVTKTFKLGKNEKNRTVSVLIKNNKTRKKVEDSKTALKKTNLSTVKNYLKEKNLIKFGTSAPSKLLRDMYESSELCGGIVNENAVNLLHNFDK